MAYFDADGEVELDWPGGNGTLQVDGDFDGGTLELKYSSDAGANKTSIPNLSFSTSIVKNVQLARGKVYFTLTGSTAPTLSANLVRL